MKTTSTSTALTGTYANKVCQTLQVRQKLGGDSDGERVLTVWQGDMIFSRHDIPQPLARH
jgi:hypothetical protein